MWYRHTTEYYSALKKEEILTHDTTRMNYENIIPSEISQKNTACPSILSLLSLSGLAILDLQLSMVLTNVKTNKNRFAHKNVREKKKGSV